MNIFMNSEIVNITGEKVTVKDINDDEYEVDSLDISKLDESVAFPMWNKIK
jgi:predicted RNA-binding protein